MITGLRSGRFGRGKGEFLGRSIIGMGYVEGCGRIRMGSRY
jgi:hypothetical protein